MRRWLIRRYCATQRKTVGITSLNPSNKQKHSKNILRNPTQSGQSKHAKAIKPNQAVTRNQEQPGYGKHAKASKNKQANTSRQKYANTSRSNHVGEGKQAQITQIQARKVSNHRHDTTITKQSRHTSIEYQESIGRAKRNSSA